MAYAGVQATVKFLQIRISELTNRRMNIGNKTIEAARQGGNLAADMHNAKNVVRGMYDPDSSAYENAMEEIDGEYELNIAKISAWENELDMEVKTIETECKAAEEQKESYTSILKSNIKADHKFCQ